MTHRFSLAILALGLTLAACDTGSPPNALEDGGPSVESSATFDAAVIDRASALDTSAPAAALNVTYSDGDRPLYGFATQEEFETAAEALDKLAKWGGEPLVLPSQFEGLDPDDFFAPAAELALTDENGQVIIGDAVATLTVEGGEPVGHVADAATGATRETFRSTLRSLAEMRANPQARISQSAEDEYGVWPFVPNPSDPEDRTQPDTGVQWNDALGNSINYWYVYAHSAYNTWTGAKRVKAATEIVFAGGGGPGTDDDVPFEQGGTALRSQFPDRVLYAGVLTEDHGCREYSDTSRGNRYLQVEIGGSRGQGQGVIESEHRQTAGQQSFLLEEYLDGENDSWARKCGYLNPDR